jgi:hypothetical protein
MAKRTGFLASALFGVTLAALALRATTLHSVNAAPLIYRATVAVNDLDSVEGLAPPGRFVEVRARQRNFKEGEDGTGDPFQWCQFRNQGEDFLVGTSWANAQGVWKLTGLRGHGNTVPVYPAGPAEDRCLGGVYTELLTRACDAPGVNCTEPDVPTLHWMNVRRLAGGNGVTTGSVSRGEQVAAAVADGPNDGPEAPGIIDVDQNGVDTTSSGFVVGQRVTWRCGAGGTQGCPSVVIHDASTVITPDPEFPFVVGTIQAHRGGGSIIAAAAIPRGEPIGFAVNVNVRFRGRLDINLGCDSPSPFDFLS